MTKSRLRIIVGENIRRERVSRDITIEELSEILKITPGFIGLIERGQRGIAPATLFKLSEIFGISIDVFFCSHEDSALKFAEKNESLNTIGAQKKKVDSLLSAFKEDELDFVVTMLQNVRDMGLSRKVKK